VEFGRRTTEEEIIVDWRVFSDIMAEESGNHLRDH